MKFEEVKVGQIFLYDGLYTEGWIVTNKTNNFINTVYILNYGGVFKYIDLNYNKKQWEEEDYFNAYVRALKEAGLDITIDNPGNTSKMEIGNYK